MMAQEFSFKLSFDDFDTALLSEPRPAIDSDDFKTQVTSFFAGQFQDFGGKARVVIDDEERVVEVIWTKDKSWRDPQQKALDLLNDGKLQDALPILSTLHHSDPSNEDVLYRLGLCYNELGQYDQAVLLLEKLADLDPGHAHALVGLGVAEIARGNLLIAEEWLRKALALDPSRSEEHTF